MIRAAILGGTGYGGMELLRYLLPHPDVKIAALTKAIIVIRALLDAGAGYLAVSDKAEEPILAVIFAAARSS